MTTPTLSYTKGSSDDPLLHITIGDKFDQIAEQFAAGIPGATSCAPKGTAPRKPDQHSIHVGHNRFPQRCHLIAYQHSK
jgi:hypothetical protein